MKVYDYLAGAPFDAPELAVAENPFHDAGLLVDAQVNRILVDVLSGTVGIILELRQNERLPANTGLLRVMGVAQQNWIGTALADEYTAWSISGATIRQRPGEFQLVAQCAPAGALRVVGASAEFILLDAAFASAPLRHRTEASELIRFGVANESTDCAAVGFARSMPAAQS
jgi:hypothetical protein